MHQLSKEQQKKLSSLEENISILNSNIVTWKQDKTIFGGITKIAKGNISRAEVQLKKRQEELEKFRKSTQYQEKNNVPDIKHTSQGNLKNKSKTLNVNDIAPSSTIKKQLKSKKNQVSSMAKSLVTGENESDSSLHNLLPGDDFVYMKDESKKFLSIDFGDETESQKKLTQIRNDNFRNHTVENKNEIKELRKVLERDIVQVKTQWKKVRKQFIDFQEDKRQLEKTLKELDVKLKQQGEKTLSEVEKESMQREKAKLEAEYEDRKLNRSTNIS